MDISEEISKYRIWVLAPHLETEDPNLQYYYDFSQSLAEYSRVFDELQADWQWQPVTLNNFQQVIASIAGDSGGKKPLVINLCDGDEVNGAPGISVIAALEKAGLPYTGANQYFYKITTSKIPMKLAFESAGVPTPAWEVLQNDGSNIPGLMERVGCPVILKPAVSGGSMGISVKNVVQEETACRQVLDDMLKGYRGWQLGSGGLLAEAFIRGREFTTFIVGSGNQPGQLIVYPPVERVFHEALPANERFLSFDRLWETYDEESPMPDNGFVYQYQEPEASLHPMLMQLSVDAYQSVGGTGYGRLDIRMDELTGKCYVLEVNAQCGLSEDEDFTSIGAILRVAGKSYTRLTCEIIADALRRIP